MAWNTSKPPRRKKKPVTLRFQYENGPARQGQFVWSDRENTWLEVTRGMNQDGLGLYSEDGWQVLGWK